MRHIYHGDDEFNMTNIIRHIKHYLPSQSPLKDFIHHNTLHAFQDKNFFVALQESSEIFGYKTSLSLSEYRSLYQKNKIYDVVLDKVIERRKDVEKNKWKQILIEEPLVDTWTGRVGKLRENWKKTYHLDLDLEIQPFLFRFLCSYLDQGISIWRFPVWDKGFLTTIRELEKNTYTSLFKTERARKLLLDTHLDIKGLLQILVGDPTLFEHYLFDQQMSHPGWSGMVGVLEDNPNLLIEHKKISLEEWIIFELLLEIDALDYKYDIHWAPLANTLEKRPIPLFAKIEKSVYFEALHIWQEAFEWTYYDDVISGIQTTYHHSLNVKLSKSKNISFQAFLCIDDRECSFRRHIESADPTAQTYGTPGFFGIDAYFKPMDSKYYMKICPAPLKPQYIIKEYSEQKTQSRDFHLERFTHSLIFGWLITHSIGFWSAIRLFINIFIPRLSPATTYSFRHMTHDSKLTVEHPPHNGHEDALQVGYTKVEMADRLEGILRSVGLVSDFAPLVYMIGHGATSVNNTHYAGYDCGACSGRPGSVNARIISYIANHPEVRKILHDRGIMIPNSTLFIGGLHDTTRDEIQFYDDNIPDQFRYDLHKKNIQIFNNALQNNAKERSRRFELLNSLSSLKKIHSRIKTRSVSLFEPRPELNHATNSLCIVGRRDMTKHIFLDRRAFMNSYDCTLDPNGEYLLKILKPAAPVCGGINLEYYFSRVDNQRLGAGTKLPHNVMGLIGVANGIDGDLRTGLPLQMIEMHDPLRLLMVVEHHPEVISTIIKSDENLYEWFINEWVVLVAIHPDNGQSFVFRDGIFVQYTPTQKTLPKAKSMASLFEITNENIPVHILE